MRLTFIGALALIILYVVILGYLVIDVGPAPEPEPLVVVDVFPPEPDPEAVGGDMDHLLEKMDPGVVAFSAPKSMNIDETKDVRLSLSLSESLAQLMEDLSVRGQRVVGGETRVSNRMMAVLSGAMFEVEVIGNEILAVSQKEPNEWRWRIRPTEKGLHSVSVVLSALVEIDGQVTPRTMETYSERVEVQVTASQFVREFIYNNWQWLWVTVVPFVAWLIRRWRRRRPRQDATGT